MIRCDNGPEFVSQSLRDWCRFNNAGTGYNRARRALAESVRSNPSTATSAASCSRWKLQQPLRSTAPARDWRLEYNHYRPHITSYMTPAEYARRWEDRHSTRTLITDWTEERGPVRCAIDWAQVNACLRLDRAWNETPLRSARD